MSLKNKKAKPRTDSSLSGARVAVLGLGVEGKSTVDFLLKQGIKPTILDQKPATGVRPQYRGLQYFTGKNYLKSLTGVRPQYDIIFRTPGVPFLTPEIQMAIKKGIVVTSQTKYFLQHTKAKTIGVTGTKGKGTTATWVYEMLKASGKKVYLTGNIGKPPLNCPQVRPGDRVVMELSSFQTEDLDKSPDISVILNITEDHLDYHPDVETYIKAKHNLVKHANKDQWVVLNEDYKTSKKAGEKTLAKKFLISTRKHLKIANTCYLIEDKIVLQTDKAITEIGSVDNIKLRGGHNWENALAAVAASHLAGASAAGIRKALKSFKGLPHRLELVVKKNGVSYYNDSFSTNAQTTIAAIKSFEEPIILIAGGAEKKLDYKNLAREIARSNIKGVVLTGEAGKKIKKALRTSKYKGIIINSGLTMSRILREAVKLAQSGDVILLSPGAASFDMFDNYKDRGNKFKEAVKNVQ